MLSNLEELALVAKTKTREEVPEVFTHTEARRTLYKLVGA